MELFGAYRAEINDPGDGTLLLSVEGLELRFVAVKPLYFRQVDGPFAMVFREDDRERITHMYTDFMPQYTTVKLHWYETTGFNMALALVCVLIFLSMILVAAIRFVRNRHLSNERKPASRGARVAYRSFLGISVLNLLFVIKTGPLVKLPWGSSKPLPLAHLSLPRCFALHRFHLGCHPTE